jgi:glycosyltransferase involved in cell wall biosynthesis
MKKIALIFPHNDLEVIDDYLSVAWEYARTHLPLPREIIAVVTPRTAEKLSGKYQGIGLMPATMFNSKIFEHTISCEPITGGSSKRAAVWSFLDKHISPPTFALSEGIVFESIYNACDGYGSSAQNMAIELSKIASVSFHPQQEVVDSHKLADPSFIPLLNKFPLGHSYVYYSVPYVTSIGKRHMLAGATTAMFSMFEATKIPASWHESINQYDMCLVPSTFCKEVFTSCGVTVPTHVVPLGVRPELYPVCEDRASQDRPFRFLLFANSHWNNTRKNYLFALNLFNKLFGGNPNVELWLKLTVGTPPVTVPPNVRIISGRFSQTELVGLMHSCDCLIFPSNGEGYSLPVREASATGMPVIYTNWGAHTDFSDLNVGYPVPAAGNQPALYPDPRLHQMNQGSANFGLFALQDAKRFGERMKWVVKHREKALAKGLADALIVREKETYAITARRLQQLLLGEKK